MPQRFDRSELKKPRKTREGFLRADGYLTRTGVFTYTLKGGKTRRELRTPEEVFHADAMASFELVPLTLDHPDAAVTSDNWRKHAVGSVGESLKQDGDFVHAALCVTDPSAIAELESGKRAQLSCGYTCDVEETPGTWNGLQYDAIQKNIRGNHVALVAVGRAGPHVRVRLDSAEDGIELGLTIDSDEPPVTAPPGGNVVKYKIDGVEYDVSEQAKQALEVQEGKRIAADGAFKKDAADATTAAKEAQAALAALQAKFDESEKARKDGADPKRVAELVKARVELVAKAAPVLGTAVKLDEMDDRAVKAAVCEKLIPAFKADGVADAVLEGAFSTAIALQKPAATSIQRAAGAVMRPAHTPAVKQDSLTDSQAAWEERQRNKWKTGTKYAEAK